MRESFEKNRMPESKISAEQTEEVEKKLLEKKAEYVFSHTPEGRFIKKVKEKFAEGKNYYLSHSEKILPELEKFEIIETEEFGKQVKITAINPENIKKNIEKLFEESIDGKILKFIENNPAITAAQISVKINLNTLSVNRVIKNLLSAELIIKEEMPFVGLGNKVFFTPAFVKKTTREERIELFKRKKKSRDKKKK